MAVFTFFAIVYFLMVTWPVSCASEFRARNKLQGRDSHCPMITISETIDGTRSQERAGLR